MRWARAALHLGSDLHKEAQGFQHACPHSLRGLPVAQVHPLQLLRQLLRSAPAHSTPLLIKRMPVACSYDQDTCTAGNRHSMQEGDGRLSMNCLLLLGVPGACL